MSYVALLCTALTHNHNPLCPEPRRCLCHQPDFANKVIALGLDVLRVNNGSESLDRVAGINAAWMLFRRSSKYDTLVVLQDDVKVYHGVFDDVASCAAQAPPGAVVGPLINAMQVGEKASGIDEGLLSYQNTQHRYLRPFIGGRIPKDAHQRLPCTVMLPALLEPASSTLS